MKGTLTRDQAIAIAGLDAVERVERNNCEPTNRVGYNGRCQQDQYCEWSASVPLGGASTLVVYYYTTNDEDDRIADTSDGSTIDWVPNGYEII